MRKMIWTSFFVFSGVGSSFAEDQVLKATAPSTAQPVVKAARQPVTAAETKYKQVTKHDFDDDQVEGSLTRPDGEVIDYRGRAQHRSLLKIRENFIPEMLKSVEGLW